MASVMSEANYATTVISCRIVRIAGLRTKKELKSARTANSHYTKDVGGAPVAMTATENNGLKTNASAFRTAESSSESSSACFCSSAEYCYSCSRRWVFQSTGNWLGP